MKNVVLLVRAFVFVSAWYDCRHVTVSVGRTVPLYDLYVVLVGSNRGLYNAFVFYHSVAASRE